MCKPLKDIVAELEAKYKGEELRYDLEERSRVIAEFDRDLEYMFRQFDRYEEDVKYIYDKDLDKNIITRSTLNLAVVMQHLCKSLDEYGYAIGAYLLDERYEKNHDLFSRFIDARNKLLNRLDDLLKTDYFEVEPPNEREVFGKVFYDESNTEKYYVITASHFHKEVAEKLNGAEMIVCVKHLLKMFDDEFYDVKNSEINWSEDEMNRVYELNYLYYAKKYWPEKELNFRPHIKRYNIISISELEKLRRDTINEFELTDPGKIWRDYSESKNKMARQMKDLKLNEKQWEYFFQNIFIIEEYTRWIEEETSKSEGKNVGNAVREAIEAVMKRRNPEKKYVFRFQSQWEGIYLVLKIKKYYNGLPGGFRDYLLEIGLKDNLRKHLPDRNVSRNFIYDKVSTLDDWKPEGPQETRIHAVAIIFNEELEKREPKI